MKKTYCLYIPGSLEVKDEIVMRGETMLGRYSGKTVDELKAEYPGVIVDTVLNAINAINEAARTEPIEITKDSFWYALECLPPVDLQGNQDTESFKMSEIYTADVTNIYVRIKVKGTDRYFEFRDVYTLKHEEILDRVRCSSSYQSCI